MHRFSVRILLIGSLALSFCEPPEDGHHQGQGQRTAPSSPAALQVNENQGLGSIALIADTGYPVDLTAWTSKSYPPVAGFASGSWSLSADHLSVIQNVNGQPMVYYSDFLAARTVATVRVRVTTSIDDESDRVCHRLSTGRYH